MATLAPPPINDPIGSFVWLEWYRQLRDYLVTASSVPWNVIQFAGSNITDIATRAHNSLQSISGGAANDYFHLKGVDYTDLTDGGNTTLHQHLIRPKYVVPSTLTVNTGTLSAGTVTNLQARGGTTVVITEAASTPGFDVEIIFSGVVSPLGFVIEGWYQGLGSHNVDVEAWNYTTSAWDKYDTAVNNTVRQRYNHMYMLSTDYVSAGAVKLRFYHTTLGINTHTLNLDYAAIISMETY